MQGLHTHNEETIFTTYKKHIEKSFINTIKNTSKLTQDAINLDGMSGLKTRHFLNNLLSHDDARYLEIGVWKGSTVCSAMCGNNATVVCVDNWSDYGGPKNDFLNNFAKFRGTNNATFIENDCLNVDVNTLPKFNMFLYDGDHNAGSCYNALMHYYKGMDDTFILLVDDWNWQDLRDDTNRAIKDLNAKVLFERGIRLTWDNSHTEMDLAKNTWWNGLYIAILQKQ